MKTINFFLKFIPVVAFILMINPANTAAQQMTQKHDAVSVKPVTTQCDNLISSTYAELQTKASKTCSSAVTTFQCIDKKSGQPIHVTLVAKPSPKGCPATIKVDNMVSERGPVSRGGSTDDGDKDATFGVEILQHQCPNGGVQLSAYIPGDNDTKEKYDFNWSANGKVIGTDSNLKCTTDKSVTLTVTDKETKTVVKADISVNNNTDQKKD